MNCVQWKRLYLKDNFKYLYFFYFSMARDNKIHLPSSGGGLVRYFDEGKSRYEIMPAIVLVLIFVVIVVEILLYKGIIL